MAIEPTIAVLNGNVYRSRKSGVHHLFDSRSKRSHPRGSNKRRKLTLDLLCLQQAAQSLLEHKRLRWRRK